MASCSQRPVARQDFAGGSGVALLTLQIRVVGVPGTRHHARLPEHVPLGLNRLRCDAKGRQRTAEHRTVGPSIRPLAGFLDGRNRSNCQEQGERGRESNVGQESTPTADAALAAPVLRAWQQDQCAHLRSSVHHPGCLDGVNTQASTVTAFHGQYCVKQMLLSNFFHHPV